MGLHAFVLWTFMFAAVQATEVNLTNAWKENLGWEITCSWKLWSNDSLQSIRLYYNEQQFMIYRPEIEGMTRTAIFSRPEDTMRVNCEETTRTGSTGSCNITIELYQPQKNSISFACEASGERPRFILEKKSIVIDAFVPPSKAFIRMESWNPESGRVVLNCTSSGLPAPTLVWTIGEQKLPDDFTGTIWNATSKLWESWSALSYTYQTNNNAICTPEVSHGGKLVTGEPYDINPNSATRVQETLTKIAASLLLVLLLR